MKTSSTYSSWQKVMVRHEPVTLTGLVRKCQLLWMQGRSVEALSIVDQLLHHFPDAADTYACQGATFHDLKRHADAEVAFALALAIDPLHEMTSLYLADLRIDQKRFQEAEQLIQNLLDAQMNSDMLQDCFARLRARQGRFDEALTHHNLAVTRAIESNWLFVDRPDTFLPQPSAYLGSGNQYWMLIHRGNTLLGLRRIAEAAADYQAAISLNAMLGAGYHGLAISYMKHDRLDAALELNQLAILRNSNEYLYWGLRGTVLLLQAKRADAEQALNKVFELEPDAAFADGTRSLLAMAVGEHEQALRLSESYLAEYRFRDQDHESSLERVHQLYLVGAYG